MAREYQIELSIGHISKTNAYKPSLIQNIFVFYNPLHLDVRYCNGRKYMLLLAFFCILSIFLIELACLKNTYN